MKKENPFKNKTFYKSYFITLGIFIAVMLLFAIVNHDFNIIPIMAGLFSIPYAIIGLIISAIVFKKNKIVALGIFLGGITPTAVLFLTSSLILLFRGV